MSSQIWLKRFVFNVAHAVDVVVAAGDGVSVFRDAEEFAEPAAPEEKVFVPIVKILHAPLFGDAGVEWYVNVDFGFSSVLFSEIIEFIACPLVLCRRWVSSEAFFVAAVRDEAVKNHPSGTELTG